MGIMNEEIVSWVILILFLLVVTAFLAQQFGSDSNLMTQVFSFFDYKP